MKTLQVKDPYGIWVVTKCVRGGWGLWRYSYSRRAWLGDPPAKGPYRTRKEAMAEAEALAGEALAFFQASEERARNGGAAMHAWLTRSSEEFAGRNGDDVYYSIADER
jgi:hypothetical protein